MRLALTGPALSGKTTLAKYLEAYHGFEFVAYNDILKHAAIDALRAVGVPPTFEEMVANKEKYRPFLQDLGELLGFDDGWGLATVVDAMPLDKPVVLDNVRFRAQWDLLAPCGFTLVRLVFTPLQQEERARSLGLNASRLGKSMQHPAELGFLGPVDEVLVPGTWPTVGAAQYVLQVLRERQALAESA